MRISHGVEQSPNESCAAVCANLIVSRSHPNLQRLRARFLPLRKCNGEYNGKRLMHRVSPVQFRLFKLLFAPSPPCPSFPTLRRSRRP
jgi:hypothetical protein